MDGSHDGNGRSDFGWNSDHEAFTTENPDRGPAGRYDDLWSGRGSWGSGFGRELGL